MDELDTPRARPWGHSEDKVKALDTVALSLGGKITVQHQVAAECDTGHPDLHQRAVAINRVGMSFSQ